MRREQYLAAIGIPVWVLRDRANAEPSPPAAAASSVAGAVPAAIAVPAPVAAAASASAPISTTETLPPAKAEGPAPEAVAGADWDSLAAMVRDCRLCALHRKRTQTVFGVGRRDAKLLVIGEAPGADEDRQGEPFVGRAGQLLNAMLAAIGFARGDVYIANILKCRPTPSRRSRPAVRLISSGRSS
jgi:DNA polymerase